MEQNGFFVQHDVEFFCELLYDVASSFFCKIRFHDLKITTKYFDDVFSGKKRFEVRRNDRDYKVGDFLRLREIDSLGNYTGRYLVRSVIYLLDDDYYVKDGYVILGLS